MSRPTRFRYEPGFRHDRLVVISQDRMWVHVRCDCGTTKRIKSSNLERTRSCGCLCSRGPNFKDTSPGPRRSPTHVSWRSMLARCFNPKQPGFQHWGGRGITVCDRWRTFESFLADMGERPTGTTIDRIDNDRNYEPGNCRWATRMEQAQNTVRNRWIEANGCRLTMAEWARRTGLSPVTILRRIRSGWGGSRAVTTPPMSAVRGALRLSGEGR